MTEKEMITARGSNIKTRNLIEQAGYTLKLAKEDKVILADAGLTDQDLTEADALLKEVTTMEGTQEISKDGISISVDSVDDKVTEAKDWVNNARLKAKRTFRHNKTVLDDFYDTGGPVKRSVPRIIAAMIKLIDLNRKYSAELAKQKGGEAYAVLGEEILKKLQDTDSDKERTKKAVPEATQNLYLKQGQLYYKLKDINDSGQEAFTGNRLKASQYNMEILHRGGAKRKEEEAAAVAK